MALSSQVIVIVIVRVMVIVIVIVIVIVNMSRYVVLCRIVPLRFM